MARTRTSTYSTPAAEGERAGARDNDLRDRAEALAEVTADAYSAARYERWADVAEALLREGLNEREAEAIMRSKHTRWAADRSPAEYGKVPATAVIDHLWRTFLSRAALRTEVAELIAQTFCEEQDRAIAEIAKTHLNLDTLETRNSDRLDFSDQAVWGIRAALQAAYEAGRNSTQGRTS